MSKSKRNNKGSMNSKKRHATRIQHDNKRPSFAMPSIRLGKPRWLALALVGITVSTLAVTSGFNDKPLTTTVDRQTEYAIELPIVSTGPAQTLDLAVTQQSDTLSTMVAEPEDQWHMETIKRGDNLSAVFQRAGLTQRHVYTVTQSGDEGKALTRVFPGEQIGFVIDERDDKKVLRKLKRIISPLSHIEFTLNEKDQYIANEVTRNPETRTTYKSAYIKDSLFLAAQKVDLSQNLTMNMASIFSGVIDFVLDVRKGDQFTVLYEQLYLDGEYIGDGNILAAQYVNRGETFNAYRFTDNDNNTGYFNEDGVSMRKAFLRAPLDFTRVSSNFNMRRVHPVKKTVRPHRGIDYAAPVGTPVFAAGDGRVTASSYSKANGKFIFIKHGTEYTTKYLHLSRRAVKNGQRVKQGQIIGHVGCTGLCTGPHLHYEFIVNGVHRNPRTILNKLPKAKSLEPAKLDQFIASIRPLELQLASYSGRITIAANDNE